MSALRPIPVEDVHSRPESYELLPLAAGQAPTLNTYYWDDLHQKVAVTGPVIYGWVGRESERLRPIP